VVGDANNFTGRFGCARVKLIDDFVLSRACTQAGLLAIMLLYDKVGTNPTKLHYLPSFASLCFATKTGIASAGVQCFSFKLSNLCWGVACCLQQQHSFYLQLQNVDD